jgi:hypothetical protein
MRIWSLHPKYLDSKGLVALWRETLLAKNVLEGKTKGYLNHPQLDRFKNSAHPLDAINLYLSFVYEESVKRKFHFDGSKFRKAVEPLLLHVNDAQLAYEFHHLLKKLKNRDEKLFHKVAGTSPIEPHPLFRIVKGGIEKWEIEK